MKIQFWSIGKAHEPSIEMGVNDFTKRISNYFAVSWKIVPSPKNSSSHPEEQKRKEAEVILKMITPQDYLILLDERGKMLSSMQLSQLLQQRANESTKNIVFLIGGAFGVDTAVMQRADFSWSLSALTFPHQLVRLILAEQVYRACTILKNEKYHHS
jgi:23S rRNA (pseudouridine1915-N3)-methyltransferase